MSAFTADEDKSLLLLVVVFEGTGRAIDWDSVLKHLSPTTKTIEDLQARLEYLKHTDTCSLFKIPAAYFAGSSLQVGSTDPAQAEVYEAIDNIFGHITKADVRPPSGKQHLNVGEIAPVGVAAMLEAVKLTAQDTFVDIGSGTGSILAQAVLQSPVSKAIGLEIRPSLAQTSRAAMEAAQDRYPRLRQVQVITGDVKDLTDDTRDRLFQATVMFCNNIVFLGEDNLGLIEFICTFDRLGGIRAVLLTQRFCHRCLFICENKFCKLWKEDGVIMSLTCWKKEPIEVYMYTRKTLIKHSLQSILNAL